jgi:hypothetical protein
MKKLLGACALLLLSVSVARAEDVASVRLGGGATLGPRLAVWDVGYGTSWDAYLDAGIGLRLGALVSLLSYPDASATPAVLALTPEAAVHFGKGHASELRVYYALELPLRVMHLSPRAERPNAMPMFDGLRLGAELQKPLVSLHLRARLGLFAALQRNEHANVHPGLSLRLTLEYGPPLLPPPPKHDDRMCPDGKTWKLPGVACP